MMKPRMIIKDENGVVAIEFAIVLPVLLLLLFGIMEFSIILYDKAMITNACREGARAGIIYDYDPSDDTYHPSDATIEAKVDQYLQTFLITFGGPDRPPAIINRYRMDYSTDPPTKGGGTDPPTTIDRGEETAGDALEVTVRYQYGFLLLPASIMGDPDVFKLGTTIEMRFE